jgi:hypothetical protein
MPSLDSEAAEEKELAENLLHVTFTPARVKYIVHPHASSLLATEDPVVEVSHELKERAEKVFASHAIYPPLQVEESKDEDGKQSEEKEDVKLPYVSRSVISQLVNECGVFVLAIDEQSELQSQAALAKIVRPKLTADTYLLHTSLFTVYTSYAVQVDKYLGNAETVTLAEFIGILARYQAPAFYYGIIQYNTILYYTITSS